MYEGVQAKMYQVNQIVETSSVRTTYLGKVNMNRDESSKAQMQFTITDQSTTVGTLLGGQNYEILLDNGSTKSFI